MISTSPSKMKLYTTVKICMAEPMSKNVFNLGIPLGQSGIPGPDGAGYCVIYPMPDGTVKTWIPAGQFLDTHRQFSDHEYKIVMCQV